MKKLIIWIAVILGLASQAAFSQSDKKTEEIIIKSSVVCQQCKDRVEYNLSFEKGIKESTVDLENKTITVKYNPAKTKPENIRKAISKIGYDADEVPADKKAYEKLPKCCKKDVEKH
jgi:copper chaperone CopZ